MQQARACLCAPDSQKTGSPCPLAGLSRSICCWRTAEFGMYRA